jgi:hypothetical protein
MPRYEHGKWQQKGGGCTLKYWNQDHGDSPLRIFVPKNHI